MRKPGIFKHLAAAALLVLLSSCIGISADITLNGNGTGTLDLEYRISASLDALGKQDGNERWNTVPLGKADFERTMARLPGLKLLSFSEKEEGENVIVTAKMSFESMEALFAFLDAGKRRSAFSGDAQSGQIVFTLSEGEKAREPAAGNSPDGAARPPAGSGAAFDKFIEDISESYSVKMSVSLPSGGTLTVTDKEGRPLAEIPGSEIHANGKKISFSFPLYEVLSSKEGIKAEFRW